MTNLKDANKAINDLLQGMGHLVSAAESLTQKKSSVPAVPVEKPEEALMNRFRQTEFLAHELPYILEANATKTKIKDEDGIEREYEIIKPDPKLMTNAGLVPFVLYSKDEANPRVHVLFRGTYDKASARRDVENPILGGPGSHSFEAHKDVVLDAITTAVKAKPGPVELNIAGHSLGGADAQNCTTAVFEKLTEDPVNTRFQALQKISAVNIMHANSAGVTDTTGKKCTRLVEELKAKRPDFKINQYVIHVHGDAVQQGGYTTILAASGKKLHTNYMLEADAGKGSVFKENLLFSGRGAFVKGAKGTYTAHTTMVFGSKVENKQDIKFKVFDSNVAGHDIKIENHLKNKVLRNLYKVIISPYKMLKSMTKAAGDAYEAGAEALGLKGKNKNK
jgi:hypothetical protein